MLDLKTILEAIDRMSAEELEQVRRHFQEHPRHVSSKTNPTEKAETPSSESESDEKVETTKSES